MYICHNPHFTNEETEARLIEATFPNSVLVAELGLQTCYGSGAYALNH